MMEFFQYSSPTRIVGGRTGFLGEAGPELHEFAGRRAGVVIDGVIHQLGVLEWLKPSLDDVGIEIVQVFDEVPPDSDVDVVERVASLFGEVGCELVIAIGGGSAMDTAKATNILLTHGGNLRDYQGAQILTEPLLPMVAVPTTVGTGSEVTMVAVIVDKEDHRKLTFVDRALTPTLAILDPAVTTSLPTRLVAATAMDALTHALEAYIDLEHSPFSDALAVGAARLIRENLLAAVGDGDTEDARANLQIASTMAGIAFNHSMVGVVHAMAHSLGGVSRVPHGVANTLMLVEGLRCNLDAAADRIAGIGAWAGFAENLGDERTIAENTIAAIAAFRTQVCQATGLPQTLVEAGVQPEHLPLLVERACEDGSMVYNPTYVEPAQVEKMYLNVMGV